MATQTLNLDRIIFGMEGNADVYEDDLAAALTQMECIDESEAEHLVAIAGEDERAYTIKQRTSYLTALTRRIDDFLQDDDGGYYQMRAYLAHHERSAAVLEIWFHVTLPARPRGGTWFRHLVVGIDSERVYADMG